MTKRVEPVDPRGFASLLPHLDPLPHSEAGTKRQYRRCGTVHRHPLSSRRSREMALVGIHQRVTEKATRCGANIEIDLLSSPDRNNDPRGIMTRTVLRMPTAGTFISLRQTKGRAA